MLAYEKASRLDPNIRTSVCHSYWFAGDTERALATDNGETPFMKLLVRIRRGEIDQVIEELQELATTKPSCLHPWLAAAGGGPPAEPCGP